MVGREAKRIAARKWLICFGRAIPLKTSLKADKEVGGVLESHLVSCFFDGIHATARLAWVESWPLWFCRHHSGRTIRSTVHEPTLLVEPTVLPPPSW